MAYPAALVQINLAFTIGKSDARLSMFPRFQEVSQTIWEMCGCGARPGHVGAHLGKDEVLRFTVFHAQPPPLNSPPPSALGGTADLATPTPNICACVLLQKVPLHICYMRLSPGVFCARVVADAVGGLKVRENVAIRWLGRTTHGGRAVGVLGGTGAAIGEEGA